jgi:hypothetical protein
LHSALREISIGDTPRAFLVPRKVTRMSDGKDDVAGQLTEFINRWPLYSTFTVAPGTEAKDLPGPILRYCRTCDATPTWQRSNLYNQPHGYGYGARYSCTHCQREELFVWFSIAHQRENPPSLDASPNIVRTYFRKLGQWPAQRTEPDSALAKSLPESLLELFKKGLTSVAHGFGIGALAYFRRVVEDGTTELLDLFADKAAAEGDKKAETEIRQAKEATRMEDRLKVAADALPVSLRPGGVNPLRVLYGHYSRGLHAVSDGDCLAIARNLEFAMTYIFKNWKQQMEDAESFKQTLQEWNDAGKPHEDFSK